MGGGGHPESRPPSQGAKCPVKSVAFEGSFTEGRVTVPQLAMHVAEPQETVVKERDNDCLFVVITGKYPHERLNESAIYRPRQRSAKEDLNRVAGGLLAGRNKLLHHKKSDSQIPALGSRLVRPEQNKHIYERTPNGTT